MSNLGQKKNRESNFSNFEVNFLIEQVREHIGVVENKKTDVINIKAKKTAWQLISDVFDQIRIANLESPINC